MTHSTLLKKLEQVETIASASKMQRLLSRPYKYISSIVFREFIYPKNKKEKLVHAPLFFDEDMLIALPAATDVYLTGGKSHDSEIRLARFIILNLNKGDHFLDIGAHYGYYTLLAANIAGAQGKVSAFEPSGNNYRILEQNCNTKPNITLHRQAVAETSGSITFYEFDNLHSEYNSTNIDQFAGEDWFEASKPGQSTVPATTIDHITGPSFQPKIIKIDVEGGEYKVIKGGEQFLAGASTFLAMEYLEPARHNTEHQKAATHMRSMGYGTFIIDPAGQLSPVDDIDAYLAKQQLESDNIIFSRHMQHS